MMNLECHITVSTEHAGVAAQVATTLHWKTSEIARDPVLGNKNFYYLTTHDTELMSMVDRMDRCVEVLRQADVPVIREKIEVIIHDKRTPT